jgi:protein-L-isoaspartate(D-aspartate) O-methyltransferase
MGLTENLANLKWLLPSLVFLVAVMVFCGWRWCNWFEPSREHTLRHDATEVEFARLRDEMVKRQLTTRDIRDSRVLEVMRRVPRHEFVPEGLRSSAYSDHPMLIGHGQTISQPYIVALMTQLAQLEPSDRVLDIGTGSGYQAAVLAEQVEQVYSIEILQPLADSARERLHRLGYANIEVLCGDGYRGLPERAPFDAIVVAAAPDHVPQPLVEQLASGGRLVIPVGEHFQNLLVIEKHTDGTTSELAVTPVSFVPMTGEAQE